MTEAAGTQRGSVMRQRASDGLARWRSTTTGSLRQGGRWAWQGLVEIGHNSLAVLGLACIGVVLFFSSDSPLRHQIERQALEWLNLRHGASLSSEDDDILADLSEPEAVARATAHPISQLPREQALIASWLARRYRVAPEPVARLVQESWAVGRKAGLDPTLILSIIAIESSFNPFAQSPVGAQGLMQVMTQVHDDKYAAFGGKFAAFDPVTNLRVGVQVLAECIRRAGGDAELGLKYYVGAANLQDDGGYADRVMAEQSYLRAIAKGQSVAINVAPPKPHGGPAAPAEPVVAAANASKIVSPAAHAAPGSVMAPAVGAALAVNVPAMTDKGPGTTTTASAVPALPAERAAPAAAAPTLPAPVPPAVKGPAQPASAPIAKADTPAVEGRVALAAGAVR